MDDASSVFDGATEGIPIPPGDLGAVVRRGTTRRRRRIAARVVSSTLVVLAAWGAATILGGQEMRPVPATPDEARELGGRLVPVVMEGPSPSDDVASQGALGDARAVTVAFHALLDVAPRFRFAYTGFERSDDAWRVEFVQWTPLSAKERALRRQELAAETAVARLNVETSDALRSAGRLRDDRKDAVRSEKRRLEELEARLRRSAARLQAQLADLQAHLADLEARVATLRERQASYDAVVTIVEDDEVFAVQDVATDSPYATALAEAIGYSERIDRIDAWGADYFVPRFRRSGAGTVRVSVRSFWTGPLGASYEERCRAEVTERGGAVVWTQPEEPAAPGAPQHFDTAPSTEDARDGGQISFGVDYDGEAGDLSLRMLCEWRPRQ